MQRFLRPLLQPQEISSWQYFDAYSNVVQWCSYIPSVFTHTQSVGGSNTGAGSSVFPQMWPTWQTALLTCSCRAARVGGICCTELFSWKELPSCMVHLGASAGYVKQKYGNLSIIFIASSGISLIHTQAPIVHLSDPAMTSMLTMVSSFHVQQSWIQCRSLSKHGTLVGYMTSLIQGSQVFGRLPGSYSSCQYRMLATVHIQRVDDLWQTQPRPQHRYQQWE